MRICQWGVENRGGVVQLPRGGRRNGHVKLDDEIRDEILDIVEQHPCHTLKQINANLPTRLPEKF